jgi:hypothetical protein
MLLYNIKDAFASLCSLRFFFRKNVTKVTKKAKRPQRHSKTVLMQPSVADRTGFLHFAFSVHQLERKTFTQSTYIAPVCINDGSKPEKKFPPTARFSVMRSVFPKRLGTYPPLLVFTNCPSK